MTAVSLLGVASYLPEHVVENDFFGTAASQRKGMFGAPTTRRHVARDEEAAQMIERAAQKLVTELDLDAARDIDGILTNVALPDQAFTGCGAEVAHRLGVRPRWVLDLHNTGCVSFIYMLALAKMFLQTSELRGVLLCNVQNAAGRVFSQPELSHLPQAPVPGDGCGVGYVTASAASPLLSLVQRCNPPFAGDMQAMADDGRRYWEPGLCPISLQFTERRVAAIIERGNAVVPEVVSEACSAAGVRPTELDLLVTNQPNRIFLRNWSEALELPREKHHDTFDRYGNLFGAALPINIADAALQHKLVAGNLLGLGGFSHAGDYAAPAVLRWGGAVPRP